MVPLREGQDQLVELLGAQVDDVAAVVNYVRRLPDVDPGRVALVGCSFGGFETLLVVESPRVARRWLRNTGDTQLVYGLAFDRSLRPANRPQGSP